MVAVNYLWNPINDNIVREFDDSGNTVAEYTTEPDQFGNVVSQLRNGQTSYVHSDGHGSTTELSDDAGSVTDTIRYSAFGEVTGRTGTTQIPCQYVGRKGYYADEEVEEYGIRSGVFKASAARWLTIRFAGLQMAIGTYVYVGNRPCVLIEYDDVIGASPLVLNAANLDVIIITSATADEKPPGAEPIDMEEGDGTCAPAKKKECRYRIYRVRIVDPAISCKYTARDVILDTIVCSKSCIVGTTCARELTYRQYEGKPERLVCSANGKYVGCDVC